VGALLAAPLFGAICATAAVRLPSAVAEGLAVLATAPFVAIAVALLGADVFQITVAAVSVGLCAALLTPILAPMQRHPAGPRWLLGVAAPLVLLPEIALVGTGHVGGL